MSDIIFYEKPGCTNNAKQKKLLKAAGYSLDVRDLLKEFWAADELRKYFGNLPVSEWFNLSAPAIKNKEVIPQDLNEKQALELMVKNPLLIRRPLIKIEDRYISGFDTKTQDRLLDNVQLSDDIDLETCTQVNKSINSKD